MSRQIPAVRIRRNPIIRRLPAGVIESPFEVFVAAICFLAGVPILLAGARATPDTIDDLLPTWSVHAWAVCLLLGGILTTLGRLRSAYLVERAGMALLGTAAAVYGLAIAVQSHPGSGLLAAATYGSFTAACAVRYYVLGVTATTLRRLREEHERRRP